MSTKLVLAGVGMFLGLSGICFAAPQSIQGTIYFHGSIVEEPCTPSSTAQGGAALNLRQCPQFSRGNDIRVHGVGPSSAVTAIGKSPVNVKLVTDSGKEGRYYDQQYALVDEAGKSVNSGMYLITLTSP
ncbi:MULTISPECIES: type 1 fimbrial protein [Pseudomonas]|uniref:type 1 fimbrial protein n=1 Tax=Pseudomonas TaxID=286 RepID=UPI002368DFDB|nr:MULTISPECIES: type 1 fimbrial protein [Pseudomonas]WDH54803.1 type 1 fimbrial protein [Pseudomonas chlororaphis]WPO50080.1 type 1 fimbrial protein [Pseudomonas sp. S1Bt23]